MKTYNTQNAELPTGFFNDKCPHCNKEVINRQPDDYGKDEIHPCEHCGGPILWAPTWHVDDIRD